MEKLDGLVRKKIKDLDEMIENNFNILMSLSALIVATLIISMHGCYLRCCNRIDKAVLSLTPHAARGPVIV